MECPINHGRRAGEYYGDYLAIDELLQLQRPVSLKKGNLIAHDEMLFIVIHQTYELWFKQILHELQACAEVLSKPRADDDGPDMSMLVHRLKRIVEIWKLLNHQVDVLETMTPLDFLEFREHLHGASGFQSVQFRKIEALLGLKKEERFRPDYYKHSNFGGFNERDLAAVTEFEQKSSILQMTEGWLARAPFFEESFWEAWAEAQDAARQAGRPAFWETYRERFRRSLSSLDDEKQMLANFDAMFFEHGAGEFSPASLRTALFIMLYRDEPIFRLPFQLLNALIEIDEQLGNFRYRHLQMVRRMIGTRVGTGGSSGEQYLQGAVNKNYIFKELTIIITFLIERRNLPHLPERLRQVLRFAEPLP